MLEQGSKGGRVDSVRLKRPYFGHNVKILRVLTEPGGVKEGRRKEAYLGQWSGESSQWCDWIPGW